jgi:AraC-like DNA-binding protein
LDQMAADIHLSKSYASRIFHQKTGSSITDYITARRLKKAYLLLSLRQQHFRWRRLADVPDFRMDRISSSYFANLPGRPRFSIDNNLNGAVSIILNRKK